MLTSQNLMKEKEDSDLPAINKSHKNIKQFKLKGRRLAWQHNPLAE
jgi:hypothetical protein